MRHPHALHSRTVRLQYRADVRRPGSPPPAALRPAARRRRDVPARQRRRRHAQSPSICGYRAGDLDRFVGPLLVHADRWLELRGRACSSRVTRARRRRDRHGVRPRNRPGRARRRLRASRSPTVPLPAPEPVPSVACEVRADDVGASRPGRDRVRPQALHRQVPHGRYDGRGVSRRGDAGVRRRVDAVRAGAPMKFTAGLHHAVRFRDEQTGFRASRLPQPDGRRPRSARTARPSTTSLRSCASGRRTARGEVPAWSRRRTSRRCGACLCRSAAAVSTTRSRDLIELWVAARSTGEGAR